jgi:acetyl esterase/lipase
VAVLAQRACLASPKIPLVLQILVVPVIDASFSATDRSRWTPSMIEHEHIYSLSTLDMLWLRDRYLPNVEDRTKPEASPIYQENKAAFDGMPHTWIAVAELDALRSEGEMYAEKLQKFGVPVTLKLMKGEQT